MISRPPISKQLALIAIVALVPTIVLAAQEGFVHASVLDPTVPESSSNYLRGLGFPVWWVSEVPRDLKDVSIADRLLIQPLGFIYLSCLTLVAVLWSSLRLSARLISRFAPANTH